MSNCPKCGSDAFWFDRTMLQPCDSMHYVCEGCGMVQECGDDACLYGVDWKPLNEPAKIAALTGRVEELEARLHAIYKIWQHRHPMNNAGWVGVSADDADAMLAILLDGDLQPCPECAKKDKRIAVMEDQITDWADVAERYKGECAKADAKLAAVEAWMDQRHHELGYRAWQSLDAILASDPEKEVEHE